MSGIGSQSISKAGIRGDFYLSCCMSVQVRKRLVLARGILVATPRRVKVETVLGEARCVHGSWTNGRERER